jgi:hypothetical protein
MVLTVSFGLSSVIGLCCHRRLRIGVPRPVGPTCLRRLDAGIEASGPHDFAVRTRAVRHRALRSLTENPPCHRFARQRCRGHRIPPRVRDDRDTPLKWGRTARLIEVISVKREAKNICGRGWTGESKDSGLYKKLCCNQPHQLIQESIIKRSVCRLAPRPAF